MPYKDPEAKRAADKAYSKAHLLEHGDDLRKRGREWYAANKDVSRRYYQTHVVARRTEEKLQALALYGPDGRIGCSWPGCSVDDPDMLTLDHVADDGKKRRDAGEGRGNKLYERALKSFVPGLQTLCANHNLKKELMRRRSQKDKGLRQ